MYWNKGDIELLYVKVYGKQLHFVFSQSDEETYAINDASNKFISFSPDHAFFNVNEYVIIENSFDYSTVLCRSKGTLISCNNGCLSSRKFLKITDGKVSKLGSYLGNVNDYWHICTKDGFAGIMDRDENVLIPFRFSMIEKIRWKMDDEHKSYLLLDEFGKKGIAKLDLFDWRVSYVLPCDFENLALCSGSSIHAEEEDIIIPIDKDATYIRARKMGRYGYYTDDGRLAVHFVKCKA